MELTIAKLLGSLTGEDSGRVCRSCGARVASRDAFGVSEGICVTCRTASDS